MPILFYRGVSLQVDPITSTFTRSIISSSQCCLFHPSPSCLCFFPPTHPFSLRTKISLSSIYLMIMKSLHSFPSTFLPGGSHEDALLVQYSPFFFFSGGTKSSFVDHNLFLVPNAFSCRCSSYSFISHYSFVPECSRYLKRLVLSFKIRSTYFEVVISFKPFNSTGAISLFEQSFYGVSFEWALTHRSFSQDLT